MRTIYRFRRLFLLIFFFAFLGPQAWPITNGTASSDSRVVEIDIPTTSCTGTFISVNTVITAAHCVGLGTSGGTFPGLGSISWSNGSQTSTGASAALGLNPNGNSILTPLDSQLARDLALIVFNPSAVSHGIATIDSSAPADETIQIVGFGSGSEQAGSNSVSGNPGLLIVISGGFGSGLSLPEAGDSGGPMFKTSNNKLVGTAVSSTGWGTIAKYANLNDPTNGVDIFKIFNQARAAENSIVARGDYSRLQIFPYTLSAYTDPEVTNFIAGLYQWILNRQADQNDINSQLISLENGNTLPGIRLGIAVSTESQNNIATIYQEVLNRQASQNDIASWEISLNNGNSLNGVRWDIAASDESKNNLIALYQSVFPGQQPDQNWIYACVSYLSSWGNTLVKLQTMFKNGMSPLPLPSP